MSEARKFYLTRYVIDVLREEAPFDSLASAEEIHHEIMDGDSVGLVREESVMELDLNQAREKALELGSDIGFFGAVDEGDE